jgi:hypothetical protein
MNECHRLGIKNFQTIRQSRRIQLAFDLCADDPTAPRSVSSKGDDYHQRINCDYMAVKRSMNDWSQKDQHDNKRSLSFIIDILWWIFRVLCLILKYTICLLWCLFKIVRCTIFRVLIESKRYRPKGFICHPIRCSHHDH